MGETWTLIEHEQSGLVMVPLHQAERELAALRAQLTEKDREIERLKADAVKTQDGYSRANMDLTLQLSASQAREREAREEARINLESAKAEAIDRDAMLARAMQAEAREREAVERAERAERQRGEAAEREEALRKQRGDLFQERDDAESALAAARKALEEIAQAPGDNIGVWCRDIARAALNGDSPDGADNNRSQTPEPPKEDSHAD